MAYHRPMRTETMVQLNHRLLELLDERAARDGVSRSAVVRDAVEAYLADDVHRRRVGQFVAGYERVPETDEELEAARANARALVQAEPW